MLANRAKEFAHYGWLPQYRRHYNCHALKREKLKKCEELQKKRFTVKIATRGSW